MEDSSILDDLDPIYYKISIALQLMGYYSYHLTIKAYVDENTRFKEFTSKYFRAGLEIELVPKGGISLCL